MGMGKEGMGVVGVARLRLGLPVLVEVPHQLTPVPLSAVMASDPGTKSATMPTTGAMTAA